MDSDAKQTLNNLCPVSTAGYDSTCTCIEGTRTHLIEKILAWVEDQSSSTTLLWLSGIAGAGKSTIAASIAERLDNDHLLGTSFVCKRDNPDQKEPKKILPTIAFFLASMLKGPFLEHLVAAVQARPNVASLDIKQQFNVLFADVNLSVSFPFVVLIDALDECGNATSRGVLMLQLLKLSKLNWLKVIVTSRPERDISNGFRKADDICHLSLQSYPADHDITVFINSKLAVLEERLPPACFNAQTNIVDQLTKASNGLFIWISTILRYIEGKLYIDEESFNEMLNGSDVYSNETEQGLNVLYTTILQNILNAHPGDTEELKIVLGLILSVSMHRPQPANILAELLPPNLSKMIHLFLPHLQSVFYEDITANNAIRVYHPSFVDYLTTKTRCTKLKFWIDLHYENAARAQRCLEIVSYGVKFNICDLESSYRANESLALHSRIKQKIPFLLQYSCKYWTSYLCGASLLSGNKITEQIQSSLQVIFSRKTVLYWIEVLSLTQNVRQVMSDLPQLIKLFEVCFVTLCIALN